VKFRKPNAAKSSSLPQRLLSINAALSVSLLLAVCGLMLGKEYLSSSERQISSLNSLAVIISDRLTGAMAFEDYALARRSIDVLKASDDILAACLYDAQMNIVTEFHRRPESECQGQYTDASSAKVSQKIIVNEAALGELVLYANQEKITNQLLRMFLYLLGVITFCYALFWVMARWFFDREIAAVVGLADTAEKISKTGQYTLRMQETHKSTKEISNLVDTFNQLLDMVEQNKQELEVQVIERTEQLLLEKQKVEEASLAKSEFLAKLSHDVRTPLTAIMGYAELLSMDPNANPAQKQKGDTIADNANFISQLVSDLLDLSKIESGHSELLPMHFSIDDLIVPLKATFTPRSSAKNLTFNIETEKLTSPWLVGDAVKVRQILNNLLDNAFKNTTEGQVTLLIKQLPTPTEQCTLEFIISDTGCGIPDDKLDCIFDDYVQLGNRQKNRQGAGLGLAITKQYVELMNGEINVRSQLAQGTTFYLTLPFDMANEPEGDVITAVDSTDIQAPPILVVEDDPNCLTILQHILNQHTTELVCASSLAEARQRLKEHPIKTIFTDIELPDGEGFELAESINQDEQILVAMSAYMDETRNQQLESHGIQHFISKPFTHEDVLRVLSTILKEE